MGNDLKMPELAFSLFIALTLLRNRICDIANKTTSNAKNAIKTSDDRFL
jgi:hypothetical protein